MSSLFFAIPTMLCLVLFIVLHIMDYFYSGCWAIAWVAYLFFATCVTIVRSDCRQKFDIIGNPIEDFVLSALLYPNVAVQLDETTQHLDKIDVETICTKDV